MLWPALEPPARPDQSTVQSPSCLYGAKPLAPIHNKTGQSPFGDPCPVRPPARWLPQSLFSNRVRLGTFPRDSLWLERCICLRPLGLRMLPHGPVNLRAKSHGLIHRQHGHGRGASDLHDWPNADECGSHARSHHGDGINYQGKNAGQRFQDRAALL